jgi:hypothetical protein
MAAWIMATAVCLVSSRSPWRVAALAPTKRRSSRPLTCVAAPGTPGASPPARSATATGQGAGHLHAQSLLLPDPPPEPACVGLICPDHRESWQIVLQLVGEQPAPTVAVVQVDRVDAGAEHQPARANEQVPLVPSEALRRCRALGYPRQRSSRLGCPGSPRWGRESYFLLRAPPSGAGRGLPQAPVPTPLAEVIVNSLTGWLLPWQHPPSTAGSQLIVYGVSHMPGRPLRRTVATFGDTRRSSSKAHSLSERSDG